MALTNSSRFFSTTVTDLTGVTEDFKRHFEGMGYNVTADPSPSGAFLSITKGGVFKSVVGMKTALNIDVEFTQGGVNVKMQVGAFGQQILPSAITLLVAWPVIIPQIMGLVEQNKLDTEAYSVIETSLRKHESAAQKAPNPEFIFCTSCGAKNPKDAAFCPSCGAKLKEEEQHCVKCGKPIPKGTAFCMHCGEKQ